MSTEHSPGMDDCLKLLRGERDEQRLAGLLLATKFCKGDDHDSIKRVYGAIGPRFLDRLLKTGMGIGVTGTVESEDRDAYLQLSVTVLAAISRVPEIARSEDMVSKIPYILDILKKGSVPLVNDECFEFFYLISTTSEEGLRTFLESGGMNVLALQISSLPDGSHASELAMRLVQSMLSRVPLDNMFNDYPSELSHVVAAIARQFALLHNAVKFEALYLLYTLLSSKYAAPLHNTLRLMSKEIWSTYMRTGVVGVLQNRVGSSEKYQALALAESLMSILGEEWLIDQRHAPDEKDPLPVDRCLLLVVESSRVEVAVLLNDLAYLKYEAAKTSSSADILLKQRNLATSFSLIEKIIKLISNVSGGQGSHIDDRTIMKIITGLNETVHVVLEFLQDAKEHGQRKGDDLLASVRIIGSYLAESPFACQEKVRDLLEYIVLIEGEDEPSPFFSVCFMLPFLCQITMETEGCKVLASSKGLDIVADCLCKLIKLHSQDAGDSGTIFLACDTLMNFLLKKEEISSQLDESNVVHLLTEIAHWTEFTTEPSVVMMASSICTLIFDSTSEDALLNHPDFKLSTLDRLSRLITRSLTTFEEESVANDAKADRDLREIVAAGYARWAGRFPHIEQSLKVKRLT